MSTTITTPGPVNNPLALAALAVINQQTSRGTPELFELVNQVRLTLHDAGQLETSAEAAFQEARQVFAGFHPAPALTPLPVAAPAPAPATEPEPEPEPASALVPPSTGDTVAAPVAEAEVHPNAYATASAMADELAGEPPQQVTAPTTKTVTDDAPPTAAPAPNVG